MYLRQDDRRRLMNTGFAMRIAILGGIALAMFAVIFFRLWYLQILSGDKYLAEANDNRTREVRVPAPRGDILDRNGTLLVTNRTSLALQVNPQELPPDEATRQAQLRRLADIADMSLRRIRREMHRQLLELPSSPVTLRKDVDYDLVYFLQEHQAEFPGVEVQRVFVRRYPQGTQAAHVFGNVGEITEDQLKDARYRGLVPGDEVGQDGVEYEYDRYLRGRAGATVIQVDSLGRPKGELSEEAPVPGDDLRLSIDSDLQAAGEAAISQFGLPAAFVAMNVRNGQILGLGSYPTFDPTIFTKPFTQKQYEALTDEDLGAPLANRATQGLYPTGSTFKPITAMAALTDEVITPATLIFDGGAITIGDITFSNAGGAAHGSIALPYALQVSSDVFFYTLGARMNGTLQLQKWAYKLGLGRPTGLDLPAETAGLIPTPAWRNRLYRKDLTDRPWSVGDNVNLSVGQGDVQTNPLQMAVAYATIANGGTVLRPHVGMNIEDSAGRIVQEINPAPQRQIDVDPSHRQAILDGLHAAAQAPGGTSYNVFGGFPIPVAGKTGTAERPPYADQSWYVVLAPYPDPDVVVAVTVEQGGFGADAAAPAAAQILSQYFQAKAEPVEGGGGPLE